MQFLLYFKKLYLYYLYMSITLMSHIIIIVFNFHYQNDTLYWFKLFTGYIHLIYNAGRGVGINME